MIRLERRPWRRYILEKRIGKIGAWCWLEWRVCGLSLVVDTTTRLALIVQLGPLYLGVERVP